MKLPSSEQWLYLFNLLVTRWVNSGKDIAKYSPKTILCIKWDEIGDMAACTHVFALLKKRFPDAKIHVITKKYSAGLLENNPNVDEVSTDLKAWNKEYDLLVDLRGTWGTLWKTFRYYPRLRLDRGTVRIQQRGNQPHETLTNYRIIEPVLKGLQNELPKLFPGEKNKTKIANYIAQNGLEKYCVIHAGARRELRKWTDVGFASIADWLVQEKGLQVVFAGIENEEEQIKKITDKMRQPFVLFTRNFDLLDLAELCERATFFLGNESGPLQIADVIQTPLLGLFGPGVKDVFYPQNANARLIHHVLDCNPCDQIHCVNAGNTCMMRIGVDEVKIEIEKLLA